jgi:hypothetical protein
MRIRRPQWSSGKARRPTGRRSRWQIDGIDIRAPLVIVTVLGLLAGMGLAGGDLDLPAWSSGTGGRITGTASVIHGDTIEVRGIRIRFDGIDAPESRQLCLKGDARIRCGKGRGVPPR